MNYAIIPAGGSGTRLWPLSKSRFPKHLLDLSGDGSLIQTTVKRVEHLIPAERILVITEESHASELRKQLPQIPSENIIVEPARRDTAPVIGLGAIHALKRDPEAVIASFPADHIILKEDRFKTIISTAFEVSQSHKSIITIGIHPTHPHTGLGYIHSGDRESIEHDIPVFNVVNFTEKPDLPTAKAFMATGKYFWNAGIFVAKAQTLLDSYKQFIPSLHDSLLQIQESIQTDQEDKVLHDIYPNLEKQPIDTGVMEKAENILVIPADIGWSDIGSWAVVKEVLPANKGSNLVLGEHVGIDTENCLIYSQEDQLIATVGVHDLAIIDSGNSILICPLEKAEKVKRLVAHLREQNKDNYL